jgi:hypothetical protein
MEDSHSLPLSWRLVDLTNSLAPKHSLIKDFNSVLYYTAYSFPRVLIPPLAVNTNNLSIDDFLQPLGRPPHRQ